MMGAINVLLMMMPLLEHVTQQMFVLQTEENFVQSNYLQLNQQNLYLMNSKRKLSSSVKFGTTAVTIVKSDTARSMDARRNHAQQEQLRLAKRRFQPQIW
jgi:Tfp pilus assembly protein PilV